MNDLNFDIYAMSDPKTIDDALSVILEMGEMFKEMQRQSENLLGMLEKMRIENEEHRRDSSEDNS